MAESVDLQDCERLMSRLTLSNAEAAFMRDGLCRQRQWLERKKNEKALIDYRIKYPARSLWTSIISPLIGAFVIVGGMMWLAKIRDETGEPHYFAGAFMGLAAFHLIQKHNEREELRRWDADLKEWEE